MSDFLGFNLKELRRLDSDPLLSIHFNLLHDESDISELIHLIKEKEKDEETIIFLTNMAAVFYYREMEEFDKIIETLDFLNEEYNPSSYRTDDLDYIRIGVTELLYLEGYFKRNRNKKDLEEAMIHGRTALSIFWEMDEAGMIENLIYAISLISLTETMIKGSSEKPAIPEDIKWLSLEHELSPVTLFYLDSIYSDPHIHSLCSIASVTISFDPFEALIKEEWQSKNLNTEIAKIITQSRGRNYEPALLIAASRYDNVVKDECSLIALEDAASRIGKTLPLTSLSVAKNLYKRGEHELAYTAIMDNAFSNTEYEDKRLKLSDMVRQKLNDDYEEMFKEMTDEEEGDTRSDCIFLLKLLAAILIIRNLYTSNAIFTIITDMTVLYFLLGGNNDN